MRWQISKEFDFCYGHRVWSQELNKDFSIDSCLACRHLHGHQGKVIIHLESDKLTKGMVTDFKHLGWFKNFIDDVLDHKFIMDIQDPLLPFEASMLMNENNKLDYAKVFKMEEGYYVPDLTYIQEVLTASDLTDAEISAIYEKYEGLVLVDFVPTSENISGWLLRIAQNKMKDLPGVRVKAVEYWETPKSHCRVEH